MTEESSVNSYKKICVKCKVENPKTYFKIRNLCNNCNQKWKITQYQNRAGFKVCECGYCEEMIPKINKKGLPSRFVNGHNSIMEHNNNWRGGITIDTYGYRWINTPDHPYADKRGYVREHRLVMEKKLGRYLKPEEVVHHINGDKQDNRIENLELYESNQMHMKMAHNKRYY